MGTGVRTFCHGAVWGVCWLWALPGLACLWDYDTLNMERSRFPGALELITGKFARHSPAYYRWRIEDRKRRLTDNSYDMSLYDDLAVAYDKLGQHEQAIATILEKEAKQPGAYETYANLGTFHIHAGNLEEGLQYIDKAIEINPEAHFGREIYQRLVVQYVLAKRQDGQTVLPLEPNSRQFQARGFAQFVLGQQLPADEEPTPEAKQAEIKRATQGVMGMMRFGNHDSPVLLECLADLLVADHQNDNKRLAARALLQASEQAEDEGARQAYRKLAADQLRLQTTGPATTEELSLQTLVATFADEQRAADDWYRQVQEAEAQWIQAERDVDAEFKRHYLDNQVSEHPATSSLQSMWEGVWFGQRGVAFVIVAFLVVSGIFLVVSGRYFLKFMGNSVEE